MQRQRLLTSIYSASFFFTVHYAFLVYIGSSYLEQLFSPENAGRAVSSIYIAASLLSLWAIFKTPILFKRIGVARTTYLFLWVAVITSFILAETTSVWVAVPVYIILFVSQLALRYVLDVYIDMFSTEAMTGRMRGIFLTVINSAIAISPVLVGAIIVNYGFSGAFLAASAFVLIAIFSTTHTLGLVKDHAYHSTPAWETLLKIVRRPNMYHIFVSNLILELFYAWMVIYTPLYLVNEIGFSWGDIGIIFSIMLLPFLIFELPAGYLADKRLGEKEMLTAGLFIMGVSTIALAYLDATTIFPWALFLFVTRIGASLVEIMVDTYFFKKVSPEDTDIIAFFRNAKPLATLVAPLVATVILKAGTYQTLFLVLGVLCLYGMRHSLAIQDTR